jgi:glycerol-3-phosphate acyltransferase PlsY
MLGHTFPLYYGFRGGKGVLMTIGVILLLTPLPGLATIGVFLLILAFTRTVSISSMIAAVTAPLWIWLFGTLTADPNMLTEIIATAIISLFIIGMHWSNIVRLIHGEENSFHKSK